MATEHVEQRDGVYYVTGTRISLAHSARLAGLARLCERFLWPAPARPPQIEAATWIMHETARVTACEAVMPPSPTILTRS